MKQLTQEQLEQVYREHPEWLVNLEVGKWYKYPDNEKFLFCVTKLLGDKKAYGYGWGMVGEWRYVGNEIWGTDNLIPATQKEVEYALIAEARKRGFKAGVEINNGSLGFRDQWQKIEGGNIEWKYGHLNLGELCTSIFHDGKWADVITPASPLAEDIQALKDKYPNYNWTIIAEAK